MSEPPCSAKVILHTSKGPINMDIWAREVPIASRRFLMNCAEGQYNKAQLAIVKGSHIACAAESSKRLGVGSVETFDRVRFNKRGILAFNNSSADGTFIITLGPSEEKQATHSILGRVNDESFYNVMSIASADCDDNGKPILPAEIRSAEVVEAYFSDVSAALQKSRRVGEKRQPEKVRQPSVKKMKIALHNSDEDEDEEEESILVSKASKTNVMSKRFSKQPQKTDSDKLDNQKNSTSSKLKTPVDQSDSPKKTQLRNKKSADDEISAMLATFRSRIQSTSDSTDSSIKLEKPIESKKSTENQDAIDINFVDSDVESDLDNEATEEIVPIHFEYVEQSEN